ncbi:MAG: FAD-dependent oxidoreductase [Allosphingosinicella sp.]|uniref:FAD-dependent oxidoreductase n=1 Tax=Allosphingosinicella sp. TaxID=2823234 RepID=UPI0039487F16
MMTIERRRFLRSAGLASGALLLPGCAATVVRTAAAAAPPCLAPVRVDESRVIRTVAGLRPYRASGFVVREERVGDARIVHNYGHGGAGITLSWGTSRLAAGLGLPGHSGPVAVIGAGVMGLTTARLVQEAGFPVTIYAAALPPDTTSDVAGGQWSPFGHYRQAAVTPEWRAQFHAALDYSWRRFQILVGEEYGVRWLPTYAQGGVAQGDDSLAVYHPGGRDLAAHEHPFPVDTLARFDTMYVETGRFLRRLLADIQGAGGRIEVRRFDSPAAIAALPERLAFNCTGLGARALFGDEELVPVRGQLAILLPQPEVQYAFTGSAGYMFPRPDGIILGGTFERGEWEAVPRPEAIARILASHRRLFAGWRCPGLTAAGEGPSRP